MPEAVIEGIIAAVVVKYTMISSVEKDFFWRRNCECEIPADLADNQKDSSSIPFGKTCIILKRAVALGYAGSTLGVDVPRDGDDKLDPGGREESLNVSAGFIGLTYCF
jgi:hypothetical protein